MTDKSNWEWLDLFGTWEAFLAANPVVAEVMCIGACWYWWNCSWEDALRHKMQSYVSIY